MAKNNRVKVSKSYTVSMKLANIERVQDRAEVLGVSGAKVLENALDLYFYVAARNFPVTIDADVIRGLQDGANVAAA